MKRIIEAEDEEDDFLSAVAAAEESLTKRRKPNQDDIEGAYTAALKGSKSHLWQTINPLNTWQTKSRAAAASAAPGSGGPDSEKSCPCGSGPCLILTANTERNRGRMFYKCPLRQENGGCGFFMWCDSDTASQTNGIPMPNKEVLSNDVRSATLGSKGSDSHKSCPCGSGPCLVLTANTEKNCGRMFYKCPLRQENGSCGFFMWCDNDTPSQTNSFPMPTKGSTGGFYRSSNDQNASTDPLVNPSQCYSNMNDPSNNAYAVRTGSSCFKCGKDGHWAKDCNVSSSDSPAEFGGKTGKSGSCYKCNKPGHWARDCTSQNTGKSYFGSGQKSNLASY